MAPPDLLRDLAILVRSRYSVVVLDTHEEDRAAQLLAELAGELGVPLFAWTLTRGIHRSGGGPGAARTAHDTTRPVQALHHVELAGVPALYHFRGLEAHLDDPLVAEKLRDAAAALTRCTGAIVLTGVGVELPEALRPTSATLHLPLPRPAEYRAVLRRTLEELMEHTPVRVEITPAEVSRLLGALRGMGMAEARKTLTRAILEDGMLSAHDIPRIVRAKAEALAREGLLEYVAVEESMEGVAGLEGLKEWLARRRVVLAEPERAREYGLPFPRGVLLLGVPGCGKSLCARAVAAEWALPLLRFDPASLYDRFVGESEKNFRRALKSAERLAPVVLWIDEIEKAFTSGGETADGGVSARVLGGFLSWMQEREGDVFVVATANDVSRLPPEFLRKGRFDEIFFVDLPDPEARAQAFAIHLRRRNLDPAGFPLAGLAAATEGFSGAEIEQGVVSGLYTALAEGGALTPALLLEEIGRTRPLSRVRAEEISRMRAWARERTVSAG